ncbi:hypothetical protein [Corynebacterium macginleyi]|uniref:hypothetical protein n=1 Tax=Corynebacterium macginleyi TaxID=38290 RepID=UPI0019092308|nr:hypothetical protein [Corynebacterium macginleyi]
MGLVEIFIIALIIPTMATVLASIVFFALKVIKALNDISENLKSQSEKNTPGS